MNEYETTSRTEGTEFGEVCERWEDQQMINGRVWWNIYAPAALISEGRGTSSSESDPDDEGATKR